MAKKAMRSRPRRPQVSGEERARKAEAQILARAKKQQQRIRMLSRQLMKATQLADQALSAVGRIALERERPAQGELELDAALNG